MNSSKRGGDTGEQHSKVNTMNKPINKPMLRCIEDKDKSYLLSDYFKRGSCYHCISKNCKNTKQHGYEFPTQFSNFVKFPTNIEEIKKTISNEKLDSQFEGKKPFFVVCKNIHQECQNCIELRVKFIDDNRILLCYGKTYANNDTITVGIHIDLKLTVFNKTKFKIVHLPIEFDIDKLIKNYCDRNEKEVIEDNKSKVITMNLSNDLSVDNEVNIQENVSLLIEDEENKINLSEQLDEVKAKDDLLKCSSNENGFIPIIEEYNDTEKNISASSSNAELNEIFIQTSIADELIIGHKSPFNMEEDFPSLSPNTSSISNRIVKPIISPINFNRVKEQVIENNNRIKAKREDEIKNNIEKDNLQKEFTKEITNGLLDEENRKLMKENIFLNNKVISLEDQLKMFNFKFETLSKFYSDPITKEALIKWTNNKYVATNSVIDTINRTYYNSVEFVKKLNSNSY